MERSERNRAIFKGAFAAALVAALVLGGIVTLALLS